MSSEVRPLGDRLILRLDRIATELAGGLIVSEKEAREDRKPRGLVTHVGPEAEGVRVGDYVMYHEYAGSKIDLGTEDEHVVVEIGDVLAVLPYGG